MNVTRQSMKKKGLLGAGLLACLGLLACTYIFSGLGYRTVDSGGDAGIRYDSREHTPIYEAHNTFTGQRKSFSASMVFQAYQTDGYFDLFQTARVNTGIRLELSEKVLALVVASRSANGYAVYIITNDYDASSEHGISIKIDSGDHVDVTYDQQQTVTELSPDLDYAIADIAVGTGLSKLRPFKGRITDFTYTYGYYEPTPLIQIFGWLRIAFAVASLILLGLLVRTGAFNLAAMLPDIGGPEEDEAPPLRNV